MVDVGPYVRGGKAPTRPVKVRTESGEEIEIHVPTDLPPEMMVPIYEQLFSSVRSQTHWKDAIPPMHFDELAPAQLMADAIAFYHGGSEIEAMPDGWDVWSKGYWHYIGA